MSEHQQFMREAIKLSIQNVKSGKGGPFGAVVVKDGKIVATGANSVTSTNDPTAHAQVVAIRNACKQLGCQLYSSCQPCPMCLGAIYWARPDKLYWANSKEDAAKIKFDDQFIYEQIALPVEKRQLTTVKMLGREAIQAFQLWDKNTAKVEY